MVAVSGKDSIMSREQVSQLIASGHCVIIVDEMVLKLDNWLSYHPGGDTAILHMVGKDATDEVNALHSAEARAKMKAFRIGYIKAPWKNFTPPIQGGIYCSSVASAENELKTEANGYNGCVLRLNGKSAVPALPDRHNHADASAPTAAGSDDPKLSYIDACTKDEIDLDLSRYPDLEYPTQQRIIQKYRQLDKRMRAEGLYKCNYKAYGVEICRYVLLFSIFLFFLFRGWYGTSGVCLGMFWHQLVFTAHDAGHMGITHNYQVDTLIGIFIADFVGGLSMGWWKRSHNVHHIITNSPEHDPDIEHMPFFMISPRFFKSLRSSYYDRIMHYDAVTKKLARLQKYLFYPVMALGRFHLYLLSWEHLLSGLGPKKGQAKWHRWIEICGQLFFWYWFGYCIIWKLIPTYPQRVLFILTSHMVMAPLHVQLTLSHFAMSTADLGVDESFPQKMLRTTMDVECPEWLDFLHGGLQFQAIHHLFPRMPRHNLRQAQKLVKEFCREVEIPYALFGFVEGNGKVIGRLADVGRQAKIYAECQDHILGAKTAW